MIMFGLFPKILNELFIFFSFYPYALFECLKKKGSRVKGGRIIQLLYLEFFKEGGGGVWRGFNYL